MKKISPVALYRAEKERVTRERTSTHTRLLAEAKAAFDKLIAEGQAARKGGRPKGSITLGSSKRTPQPVLAAPMVRRMPEQPEKVIAPAKVEKKAAPVKNEKVKPAPKAKATARPKAKAARKPARAAKSKPARPVKRTPAKKKR